MGESWVQREILTLRRLIFNFLWYGSQIGVFAYGWYALSTWVANRFLMTNTQVVTGYQRQTCWPQQPEILRLDFPRRWSRARLRWLPHPRAHAA